MTFRHTLPAVVVAVMVAGLPGQVRAADFPFTFTITIQEPACTVTGPSNEAALTVDFGMQGTLAVNTSATDRTLNMNVSCGGPSWGTKKLSMSFAPGAQSTISVGGKTVLGTTMPGLGIEIRYNGAAITPVASTWHAITGIITSGNAPSGTVPVSFRLVSNDVYALKAEGFSASVTVAVKYN